MLQVETLGRSSLASSPFDRPIRRYADFVGVTSNVIGGGQAAAWVTPTLMGACP